MKDNKPKMLVGLIFSIENELDDCLRSIHGQTYKNWELFRINSLPKKKAHDELYGTFMKRAGEFDLFVKIDADMVLARNTFFEELVSEYHRLPRIEHFQVYVWDHFTQKLISGLHTYRSSMRWKVTNDEYFTDQARDYNPVSKYYSNSSETLVPAAYHCPSPSEFQSFHFGVHKASKLLQTNSSTRSFRMARWHSRNIQRMFSLYAEEKFKPLYVYALVGCIWALENRITHKEVDFNSEITNKAFTLFNKQNDSQLTKFVDSWIARIKINPSSELFFHFLNNRYFHRNSILVSYLKYFYRSVLRTR